MRILYLSEDGHLFEFRTKEKNIDKAIKEGFKKLERLGYRNYNYSIYSVKET
jgi:hypothetical protein